MGFRGLGREDAQRLLRWGPMAVADFASEWFSTEVMRALVCGRGIHGLFAGPWSAGTTANLLLQSAAGDGNAAGTAVQLTGGLGSLAGALTAAARQYGAEIRTGAEVERIAVKDGRVTGVVLAGGEEIAARAVVSSADPKRTFLGLLDPAVLDPDDVRRMRNYRQKGMASKVNLALDALPSFRGGVSSDLLRGRIHIGPDVDDLERAFDDAKYGGISRKPYLEATIPTLSDTTLAPAGKHVMSVYVQFTPYALREGTWDTRRDEVGDAVAAYARSLRAGDHAPRPRPAGAHAARPRADVRPDRRPPVARRGRARSALPGAAAARLGPLPRPAARPVHVRGGHTSGRRRHRRSGRQRRAGDPGRPQVAVTTREILGDVT